MSNKKVILKSSDGDRFEIEEKVALQSQVFSHMIEDNCVDEVNVIPLQNITTEILVKVIEYCKKHVDIGDGDGDGDEVIKKWDEEFVKIDQSRLVEIALAAHFLEIRSLINLTCQTMADMIKDKSVEEVRELLNIENDFTEEEEENLRTEYKRVFE